TSTTRGATASCDTGTARDGPLSLDLGDLRPRRVAQPYHLGPARAGRGDGRRDGHLDPAPPRKGASATENRTRPDDRHGDDRLPALDRCLERAEPEGTEAGRVREAAFREDQQGCSRAQRINHGTRVFETPRHVATFDRQMPDL